MHPIVIEVERKIYVRTMVLLNGLKSKEAHYYYVHRLKHIYFSLKYVYVYIMNKKIIIIT